MKNHVKLSFIFGMFFTLLLVSSEQVFCYLPQDIEQAQEDESKGFQPKSFVKRPAQKKATNKPPSAQPKYRRISKPIRKPAQIKTEMASVGFTVWKLKALNNNGTKGVGENQSSTTEKSETVFERVNSETPLVVGEVFQLSVESLSHNGFLYIIHRELYVDDTYSIPKIIYPIRGKNNYVTPGMLISTGVFDVLPPKSKKQQVAEVFTVIISPKALVPPEQLRAGFLNLDPAKFNEWINKWKVDVSVIEQETGAGQEMTEEEAKGIGENVTLTQDDPLPLTFYQSYIKPGDAILTNVHVKFKSTPK